MRKVGGCFSYRLLKADIVKLSPMESSEPVMNDPFANSDAKTVTVTENIHYGNNEYKVTPEIASTLDAVVNSLQTNQTYKLEIYSHTDSRGNDDANMTLSNNRAKAVMDYIVSKGIDKSRISAKGMGESKLLNNCKNGVNCPEKDHEVNRRTEFKYIK
jgi:outer membrane protein OmpA-like peptidoglycan-associated protein